jgi:glycine cleavage system H protein
MSKVLENLLYASSHEWARIEGDVAYVGISDYAQHALGSVVFVDLPSVGDQFVQDEEFGAVESVKAASDLLMPLSGEVLEVNDTVIDQPELLNQDPYEHWLIKIQIKNAKETKNLLNSTDYTKICK